MGNDAATIRTNSSRTCGRNTTPWLPIHLSTVLKALVERDDRVSRDWNTSMRRCSTASRAFMPDPYSSVAV
ncbi:hypothetical protein HYQ46_010081 [Verticillium longisporum]|nr:hypothetical protein HYQ46_010081 [Verticillium longisporum]